MMKFLGSLPFAMGLIAATVTFVIAGTFLESWSESHLFAAALTYHNPVFQLLLWLYFINILLSALNRFPFKKRHIPFLLTHLGLLMLLMGVFVKNHFGVQGACALTEGGADAHIFVPTSYALHVEDRQGGAWIKIPAGKRGTLRARKEITSALKGLELTIVEWLPHAEERLEGFIKGGWGHLVGHPPFEKSLSTPDYQMYTRQVESQEEISFPGQASLFFLQDKDKQEHLVAFNASGSQYVQSLDPYTYYVYDKGYGGYALFAELPEYFPKIDLIAPITRAWTITQAPRKQEEAKPRIRLLARLGEHKEIVTLSYDRYGQGFKWPILGGKFLVRFQAHRIQIPMRLRLQSARQINYPGTTQPYSYEAKVLIDGQEARLSMNHVYEKQGYRFYLANLIQSPGIAHQVQIVVNYDPAKYWLTYPGAIILALGIIFLYLRKHYV